MGQVLRKLLGHPNIASKKWVVQQYDHEVQGGSVVKPFVGFDQRGPNDACVFRPRLNSDRAVVVANGFNPSYGEIDPYWMRPVRSMKLCVIWWRSAAMSIAPPCWTISVGKSRGSGAAGGPGPGGSSVL